MNPNYENNKVFISGTAVSDFRFCYENRVEKFYLFDLEVQRNSGVSDVLPVTISDRIIDVNENFIGKSVNITGSYRSYNLHEKEKTRLVLTVFCTEFESVEFPNSGKGNNSIELHGFICKQPIYRVTPLGREIADLLIAVNRPYGKSDYIPCVLWGRNAKFAGNLSVGEKILLSGRIQSRYYNKNMPDGTVQEKVAYEVSANFIEVQENED